MEKTPETDYYIRTYATNAIGTTYGTEASFTTRATSECVADCNLACDMTDSQWEDPTAVEWSTALFKLLIFKIPCVYYSRCNYFKYYLLIWNV